MKGHNICFPREIRKSSLNYPQYSLLSGALISSVTELLHNRIMTPNIQEYLSYISQTPVTQSASYIKDYDLDIFSEFQFLFSQTTDISK